MSIDLRPKIFWIPIIAVILVQFEGVDLLSHTVSKNSKGIIDITITNMFE